MLIYAALLAVVAGGCVWFISTRPDTFRVVRSVEIARPPDVVFAMINDLRSMNRWNPFDREPDASVYSGPPAGVGAIYDFDGRKVGTGSIRITQAQAPVHVAMQLVMSRPMVCDNRIDFTVEPIESGSRVTWAMSGPMSIMAKCMQLVMTMDGMVGGEFEKGLAKLKLLAEAPVV